MVTDDDDFDDDLTDDDDDDLDDVVGDDLGDAADVADDDDSDTDVDDDDGDDDGDDDSDDEDDEEEEASLEVLLGRDIAEDEGVRGADVADVAKARVAVGEGEFTCRSCFLVKRRAQLADADQMICLDCA